MSEHENLSPSIHRTEGITASERYLGKLCGHTFLSLWSYSSLHRDQGKGKKGDGKELCDLLVVFEDNIIIFSDKDCTFPDSGNLEQDWSRWFRKAILKSAEQTWGAERWIRSYPERIFLDRACQQPFPLDLPDLATARFHRVVVAKGSSARCKQELGGSGSFVVHPDTVGAMHQATAEEGGAPFTVGQIDPSKGYVHILDDTSLDIVLGTLDTISDFVDYLTKKVTFIRSGRLGMAAGEEDLLAYYLSKVDANEEHDFIVPPDVSKLYIDEGHWERFTSSLQRRAQLEANEISYTWDALIETFSKHIIGGTQYFASHAGVNYSEKTIRLLAGEPRTRRRMLASALLEIVGRDVPPGTRHTRLVLPSRPGDPHYVFLFLSRPDGVTYERYREVRREFLYACCKVLKVRFPGAQDIMGIAMEGSILEERSEDAVYFDAREWTEEDQDDALDIQKELGLFQDLKAFATRVQEYPELSGTTAKGYRDPIKRYMKGRDRNSPCLCGSGKKYKKCCGK